MRLNADFALTSSLPLMKALINGLQIGKNNSGVQYYAKHLHNAIQTIKPVKAEIQLYQKNTKPCFFLSLIQFPFKGRLSRILNKNIFLITYLIQNKYDLFHSPNYLLPFFIKTSSILTIHDLITFDLPKLWQRESVLYFKLLLHCSIKRQIK